MFGNTMLCFIFHSIALQQQTTHSMYGILVSEISAVRNINVNGATTEESDHIINLLKSDNLGNTNITAVKQNGKHNLTYKFKSPEDANQIETILRDIYADKIAIKPVVEFSPQLKITRLFTNLVDKDTILNQIIAQNSWLQNSNIIIIDRIHDVPATIPYKNIIVKCDLKTHNKCLEKNTLIFAFSECKIYEYINILQCAKCSRFGHFARECTFAPSCRKCGNKHETIECQQEVISNNLKCPNCTASNSRGIPYNNKHKVTDERCSARIERVEALKKLFKQKN